jgi:crotonobetainyl-CoA:carnitine CoA-transferase CaiB-like acyl-CoA transferase
MNAPPKVAPKLPLSGIRVLDAGQVVSGPFLAQLLGDFGADVIKIEHPRGGDPYRRYGPSKNGVPLGWKTLARNKRSITLNLAVPKGAELFKEMAKSADVVIQSFRPETVKRYGLTYEALSLVNPRIIVVLVSGFGQDGPYADRPGFGTLAEAMSGYADLTGQPGGPPTLPSFALADSIAALYGAMGTLNALYWRDALGGNLGQLIDVSLLEPLFGIFGPQAVHFDQLHRVPKRTGSRNNANAPRNVYQTMDGRWVAVAASVQDIARRAFEAIGRPELFNDPRFATPQDRVANVDEVDRIFGEWASQRTREEAMEILLRHEVAAAPVFDISDLMADPHMAARNAIRTVEDSELGPVRLPAAFPLLSRTPGSVRSTGPTLGAHNDEVYSELLALNETERTRLRADGVI